MAAALHRWPIGLLLLAAALPPAQAADPQQVLRLLDSRRCNQCQLQDADLVQADLREARLQGALLQRANLSGARLDGADLRGADLSFTSLNGASLRGSDLRGANLNGTDLRQADLSGSQLEQGQLSRSHWQQARGLNLSLQSYAELHNAGIAAAQQGRFPEAEEFFGQAIRDQPEAAISWVARGISRAEQGKTAEAIQDLNQASQLYLAAGDTAQANQLNAAVERLQQPEKRPRKGNGLASNLASGAIQALQILAPIAIKAMASPAF
jgi:tetratricopeptide (TPR) repeat protein